MLNKAIFVLFIALFSVSHGYRMYDDNRTAKRLDTAVAPPPAGGIFSGGWANYPQSGLSDVEALRKYTVSDLESIVPRPTFLNKDANQADPGFMVANLGDPQCTARGIGRDRIDRYCAFENICGCGHGNTKIAQSITKQVFDLGKGKTITLRGVKPWVDFLVSVLGKIKSDLPDVAAEIKTAGSVCCRKIKRADGSLSPNYSNHSWGTAVDLYVGAQAKREVQKAIAVIARYFVTDNAYWIFSDDAMHFEASKSMIEDWKRRNLI